MRARWALRGAINGAIVGAVFAGLRALLDDGGFDVGLFALSIVVFAVVFAGVRAILPARWQGRGNELGLVRENDADDEDDGSGDRGDPAADAPPRGSGPNR